VGFKGRTSDLILWLGLLVAAFALDVNAKKGNW